MMGCRHGAKNTLDLNYLYLAEKRGVQVFAETKVVDVKPLAGATDGGAGYEVHTVKSTAWIRRQPRRFTCRGVVFSASSLGTMELLFHLRKRFPARHQRAIWENTCAPIPSRSSECVCRVAATICPRASPSAPASTLTKTRTSKRSVIPTVPTP